MADQPSDAAERVEKLEEDVKTLAWLHAELMYAMKKAAIQRMMSQLTGQPQGSQPAQTQQNNPLAQALTQALAEHLRNAV